MELIRVAVLWGEMWHAALEEASKLYFTDQNPDGMIAHLEPMHKLLEEIGPQTARETSFLQVYGRDLREAHQACCQYRVHGEPRELEKAWEIYYSVFKRVEKSLPQLTTLDLQYVSPQLLGLCDLQLAVPGALFYAGRSTTDIY